MPQKKYQPDGILSAVVGHKPLRREHVHKKIWEYIKEHRLQDAQNKRMINTDEKLGAVLGVQSRSRCWR
jgi:chromatin remodeling complex protein RSC6